MRIKEAAAYLGMSPDGVRGAARAGRLRHTVSAAGQRIFTREDLDAYLGRPSRTVVGVAPERVEALYVRVSGSTGQETSLANQEAELRVTSTGRVHKVYRDRASGLRENRRGLSALLDDAAARKFTVVRVVHADRLARFGVAWIERYLGACGVTLEVDRRAGDASLHEELLADFMALLASFSGRFYQLRSKQNQLRLLDAAKGRLSDE